MNIIFTVYLYESIPAIARGTTITLINLIGLTAMAGYGAGGPATYAITWGYNYGHYDIIWRFRAVRHPHRVGHSACRQFLRR